MDNKAIIEKALKGEDYSVDVKDFTDEQKATLSLDIKNAADAASKEELAKVTALRKERERLEKPPVEAPKTPETPPVDTMKQFREEQVAKAKEKFYAQLKPSEEDKAKIDAEFAKLDSGKVDADLIIGDLRKAYAVVNADTLIDTHQRFDAGKGEAARRTGGDAMQSAVNSPENDKFSPEAKKLFLEWQKAGITGSNYSLEAAQNVVSKGLDRNLPA